MERLKLGHDHVLAELFNRHYRIVLAVAFRILRDRGEAEDLMQEVFLQTYRDAEKFDPSRGSVRTWLLQYAYHRSLNRKKYLLKRDFYTGAGDPAAWRERSSVAPVAINTQAQIQAGLEQLSEKERRTIELACIEGMTLREVAERQGEALPNTRNHYYRGLKKLRALLFGDCSTIKEARHARR